MLAYSISSPENDQSKRGLLFLMLFEFQTYTGNILIAINPFQRLPHLAEPHTMEKYKCSNFGELDPHVFAIADISYR